MGKGKDIEKLDTIPSVHNAQCCIGKRINLRTIPSFYVKEEEEEQNEWKKYKK